MDPKDEKRADKNGISEKLARLVLGQVVDAVVACDVSGRIIQANQAAAELCGRDPLSALFESLFPIVLFSPNENEENESIAARALRGEILRAVPGSLARPDGSTGQLLVSAAPLRSDGETIGCLVTVVDVTRVRQVETDLRASRARFKLLSDVARRLLTADNPSQVIEELCRNVMVHLDCDTFFSFLADEATGRLRLNTYAGVSRETAANVEWLDSGVSVHGSPAGDGRQIVREEIHSPYDPRMETVVSFGIRVFCSNPLVVRGKVAGALTFGTSTRPQFSDDEIAFMRTVADEIAEAMERVQAREALRAANAKLVESDRNKDEFLAVLSHELRNPLAPITNSLYVLERAAPGSEQARRALAVIGRQTGQLSRLVDDLLDVTRVSRNKIRLQRDRLELNELLNRVVEDHRWQFDKGHVRLDFVSAPIPVFVNGDQDRLTQVVGNLLTNAAKFTLSGGRTTVSLSADAAENRAVLRIADTGVGLTPDMLSHLFQPFMQADTTLDRSKGGLGLGLALVKGLVELHGGDVQVQSDGPGKGTQFTVRLPLEPTEAVVTRPEDAGPPQSRRRVLIIEDNVDAAHSLRDLLEADEHQVAVAYDGPQGIAKAREFGPDVVLCDIGLPGMNGFDVARVFRADAALKGIRLVALSGYSMPEDLQRASEAGFERHLAKPPDPAVIEGLLRGSQT
jgi:PAS domain S-box-containing protein